MKKAVILVPILFLLGLIYVAYGLYQRTQAHVPCTGDQCDSLTAEQLADMAISAEGQ